MNNTLLQVLDWNAMWDRLVNWVIIVGPRILFAIILLLFGLWLIRFFIRRIHIIMDNRKVDSSLKPFLISLINIALQLLLFLLLMQVLGVKLTLFASLIAAIGVAAGLALSGTLQNFTSGILILLLKPYRVGDNIIAQGQEGLVNSIQIFYTVVTTYDNKTVIIPNSKLSNEVIINISREGIRRLDVEFKVNYGIDFKQVEDIMKLSIKSMEYALEEPKYRIGVSTVFPDGYNVLVSIWINAHAFQDVRLLFQEQIITDLKSNGIKLPGM